MDRRTANHMWLLVGVVAFFCATASNAQQVREVNWTGLWFDGLGAIAPYMQTNFSCTVGGWTYEGYNGSRHQWSTIAPCDNGTTAPLVAWMFVAQCDNGDPVDPTYACDPPPSCDASFVGQQAGYFTGTGSIPGSLCDDSTDGSATGCALVPSGVGVELGNTWGMTYVYTDQPCSSEPSAPDDSDENCIATGSSTYCVDNDNDSNCGTINGEYICVDNVPDGGCIFTAGGQAICDSGSNSQAADDTFTDANGDSFDVYGDGLDGSGGTATGTDDGTVANGGTNAAGPGAGNGEGGSGEGECDNGACDGILPGENEAVDDFGTLFGGFYSRVENAPLVSAYSGLAGSMPLGSCNGFTSEPIAAIGGNTLTMDAHCQVWPTVVPIISPIMLALWALVGALIILRA